MEKHCHCGDETHFVVDHVANSNRESISEIMDKIAKHRDHSKLLEPKLFFLLFSQLLIMLVVAAMDVAMALKIPVNYFLNQEE